MPKEVNGQSAGSASCLVSRANVADASAIETYI
jgi:hypothetical protein